jgi:hypothetical protein
MDSKKRNTIVEHQQVKAWGDEKIALARGK